MVPILSIVLGTLALGAVLSVLARERARWVALGFSVIFLAEVAYLIASFSGWAGFGPSGAPTFSLEESYSWISISWLQVNYTVGVDGISLVLILLSSFLLIATVIYSWNETRRPGAWFGLVLLTVFGCVGVFVALDILLFFLFWEAVLVPMFFLIGYWGGPRRRYAAIKFFIYTHVASVVMLVALLATAFYSHAASLDFSALYVATVVGQGLTLTAQVFLFLSLLFGFGVKFPLVPFHTWLPDAHVEAPTGGSVLLAGLLLKLGGYGLIRWGLELLPDGFLKVQWFVFAVAMVSIVWGAWVSLAQRDLKRLVAYSSINHMGIVLLAIATYSSLGLTAAVLLMFAHGIVSALLFMVSGSVHHAFGTRDVNRVGGISPKTPVLASLTMVGALASLGLPALISFPAEFTALLATWNAIGFWVLVPLATLVVTAAFYIWMMQRMLFGPPKGYATGVHDVSWWEWTGMGILAALAVVYGIFPGYLVTLIVNSPIQALFH